MQLTNFLRFDWLTAENLRPLKNPLTPSGESRYEYLFVLIRRLLTCNFRRLNTVYFD